MNTSLPLVNYVPIKLNLHQAHATLKAKTHAARGSILIVDDESANLDGLHAALNPHYKVFAAQNAYDALKITEENDIDVVISDQRMPEMQGTELLARLSQVYPHQIRILLTGYTDVEDLIDCVNRGLLYRYLVKPWKPSELLATVAQAFDKIEVEQRVRQQESQLKIEVEERRSTQRQLELTLNELREAQATLVAQEKLRALGELVSGVAHDFNNLLTPIKMYCEELLFDLDEPDESEMSLSEGDKREALETINCAVIDGSALIERLKSSYHAHAQTQSRHVVFSVSEILRHAITLALPRWRRFNNASRSSSVGAHGAETHYLSGGDALRETSTHYLTAHRQKLDLGKPLHQLVVICAAPPGLSGVGVKSEIRQALVNFICNALDALRDAAPHCPLLLEVSAEIDEARSELKLSVRDHALGMPEEVLARCKEAFYSTKGSHGSGLGLHMVHQTALNHRGRLELSSDFGQGTLAQLIIPHVMRRYET